MDITFTGCMGWVIVAIIWIWWIVLAFALIIGGLFLLTIVNYVLISNVIEKLLGQWGVYKLFVRYLIHHVRKQQRLKRQASD